MKISIPDIIKICERLFAHNPKSNEITIIANSQNINAILRLTGWACIRIDDYYQRYITEDSQGFKNSGILLCDFEVPSDCGVYKIIRIGE